MRDFVSLFRTVRGSTMIARDTRGKTNRGSCHGPLALFYIFASSLSFSCSYVRDAQRIINNSNRHSSSFFLSGSFWVVFPLIFRRFRYAGRLVAGAICARVQPARPRFSSCCCCTVGFLAESIVSAKFTSALNEEITSFCLLERAK